MSQLFFFLDNTIRRPEARRPRTRSPPHRTNETEVYSTDLIQIAVNSEISVKMELIDWEKTRKWKP